MAETRKLPSILAAEFAYATALETKVNPKQGIRSGF
jgi:hypothetical protein